MCAWRGHAESACGCVCRWFHPAPPTRVVMKQERSFEGINLETPGATTKHTAAITRFQLCNACYENERRCSPTPLDEWSSPMQ